MSQVQETAGENGIVVFRHAWAQTVKAYFRMLSKAHLCHFVDGKTKAQRRENNLSMDTKF